MQKVSIIIPMKDEPYIYELVRTINSVCKAEIIIVDKSEITPEFVYKNVVVIKQKSDGLGNAIKEGLAVSKCDNIIVMDADGQHDPKDIHYFLDCQDYDLVMGYKNIDENPFIRKIVSKVMNYVARKRLGLPYRDLMSGFFMVNKKTLNKIKLNPKGFKILMEIAYKFTHLKTDSMKTAEVPITFHRRKAGESKVGLNISGLHEVIRIFKLINNLKRGE